MRRSNLFALGLSFLFLAVVVSAQLYGTARPAGCGNGICDSLESTLSCPVDCTRSTAFCGDYVCSNEENKTNCPEDCGAFEVCGDTACIGKEDSFSCPLDCGLPPDCGNNSCEEREHSYNCPTDCGYAESCGNAVCEAKENHYNCLADCKRTQYRCGDGLCDGREDSFNCAMDCGAPSTCGDDVCNAPLETSYNCPLDCGELASCGNKACDELENAYNCTRDCKVITPGDSFESATLVKAGIFERKYTKNNLKDFFKLVLDGGEKLVVSSTCRPLYWGPKHRASPAVFVYNEARDLLAKQSVSLKEKDDAKEILLSWATNSSKVHQTLYVEVGPESAWLREFTCTTKFEVQPLFDLDGRGDAPESFEDAFGVEPGLYEVNWLVGGEGGADEKDVFKAELKRGEKLEVKVIPSPGADFSVQFFDASLNPLNVRPFVSREEVTASYAAEKGQTLYFSVSRIASGRYALSVGVSKVDLCYYVKCGEGEQCLNGDCLHAAAPDEGQPVPSVGQPEFPSEPLQPRKSFLDSIVSFILGLFGAK